MPVLPFPAWEPDKSDFNGATTSSLDGVLPRSDGYGPMRDLSAYTSALPAACRGSFMARRDDGSINIFAGTVDRLYRLDNTTLNWVDVSKSGSAYTALSSDANWSFAQFNDKLIATQANSAMQVFDVPSGTAFADLAGSPPQAAGVAIINRFLLAYGIVSFPRRIHWSGLNAITTWTVGTTFSDTQDFPDGGNVKSVIGGEFGVVIQDNALRRMVFSPGSDIIFQIDRIAKDVGTIASTSVVESGGLIYFLSAKGFVRITPDGGITPIGFERVDRTFFGSADLATTRLIQAVSDPAANVVLWTYRTTASSADAFNRALVYNYALNRWAPLNLSGEFIAPIGKPGITLESLDTIGAVDVSGAADNGAGLVRLTVASTTGWTTGDIKVVADVTGTTEANGSWTITVVDGTHIDLQGSTFANAYVSGGYVAGSIDDLDLSLDDFASATLNNLGMFNADHVLGYFTGDNVEATLTTSEQSGVSKRIFVRGFYPVTDAPTGYASTGARESMTVSPAYSTESLINTQGFCPQRVSTRHARGKFRIPAGTVWTFATGMEPDYVLEGRR